MQDFYSEIISAIKQQRLSKDSLSKLKLKLCRKYGIRQPPTDIEILLNAPLKDVPKIKSLLITKPIRSISGVAVVAIMTKPYKCPHGKCDYCPGGPNSHFGDVPQSYTGKEPATRRAIRNDYDPYLQVFNRLEQYVVTGHVPDKVELIVMGGTFPSVPKSYQKQFVRLSFQAMNDFSRVFFKKAKLDVKKFKEFFEMPCYVKDETRAKSLKKKILKLKSSRKTTLEHEHLLNEKSNIKCVGLTIETRPDRGLVKQGNYALELGATRIELGIESVFDSALKKIHRGHTVADSIKSIQQLKDLGFKLNFHYMPGLPGVSREDDLKGMLELFKNPDFRPDMLKIYPCMVLKGTEVYDWWKKGAFKPLSTEEAAELIADFKPYVPSYCRIMRIQRDIPTVQTEAGVGLTNLRQTVTEIMKRRGTKCRCIRCREVGRASKFGSVSITVTRYEASGGTEFFIAAEDRKNDVLVGFCRLRFPSASLRKEITPDNTALIRELHVYGTTAALGEHTTGKSQHKGYGKRLLAKAEQIVKQNKKTKLVVISGVGVRNYYAKLGYRKEGPYVVKNI